MQKLKEMLASFLVGVGIGSIIEGIISVIVGTMVVGVPSFVATHDPVFVKLVQILLYGGFGIVGRLAGYVYKFSKINLFLRTSIHIIALFAYFTCVAFYLHWITNVASYLIGSAIFFLMYIIIWSVLYVAEKQKVNAINAKLEERAYKA